jgi:hypothetical protein
MIIPREVQNPMQDKDLHFLARRMPQRARVASCNIERYGYVSGETLGTGHAESGRRK